ncbi:hypothetical protein V3589_11090 [Sinorhizobium fredii]|uniref:hypothetical protein n=1 Tax=Rhizobium fredii TaxID=380 RepID=UPI0030968578
MSVLLTRRAVVQVGIEGAYNVPAVLGLNDGVLVADPTYTVEPNVLEREFTRDSLSVTPHIIGRKLARMEFQTELRGNGKQNSGLKADAAIITRLMRACGYKLTGNPDPGVKGVFDFGDHANRVSWAADASNATNTDVIAYFLAVTTGGASGTAQIEVTSDIAGEESAAAVVTSAAPFDVGTKGLVLTPTFNGDLVVGQRWVVYLVPPGLSLDPISDDFESVTLVMYKDGVKHLMPGAFGTFEIDATAGNFATINWTFTGTYSKPIDEDMPNPDYERTLPSQVELARLRLHDFAAVVEQFTFNQGNDVQIRPDVSSSEGYIGTRLVARNPEGGVNPEADRVANYDFWEKLSTAERMPFQMRVGSDPGNTVWVLAPGTQYTGLTYTDRNGILAYDAGLKFPAYNDDDEVCFFFC